MNAERLRKLIRYDPETGLFRWFRPLGRASSEWFAGTPHGSGYLVICVDRVNYRAHRLAWPHVTGEWPSETIDHRNRRKDDNRFANLRDVSQHANNQNRDGGVERRVMRAGVRWRARIHHLGRLLTVGTFTSQEQAEAARTCAKLVLHEGYIPEISPSPADPPESSVKSVA